MIACLPNGCLNHLAITQFRGLQSSTCSEITEIEGEDQITNIYSLTFSFFKPLTRFTSLHKWVVYLNDNKYFLCTNCKTTGQQTQQYLTIVLLNIQI